MFDHNTPLIATLAVGLGLAYAISWELGLLLTAYKVLTIAYTFRLKHTAILDIVVVATGFAVRAISGGVAVDITLSKWFLAVTCFGSLFMVAGKRHGEFMEMGEERASTRASLRAYSDGYLRYVWTIASAVTMVGYSLWAFQLSQGLDQPIWYELSVAPFIVALLRYAYLVEGGQGGEPEEVVLGFGAGKRVPVIVTINGYSYQSTVAVMGGKYLVGVNAAHRAASGVAGGEEHEVTLTEERVVVNKETVPVERVKLGTETVTEEQQVSEEVRKEQIEADLPDEASRRENTERG